MRGNRHNTCGIVKAYIKIVGITVQYSFGRASVDEVITVYNLSCALSHSPKNTKFGKVMP